jgi:type VI secretion system protein ImpA
VDAGADTLNRNDSGDLMPDANADASTLSSAVDAWLLPLEGGDSVCGPDLEYDPEFLELTLAIDGKPATQFSPGEPPDWVRVRDGSTSVLARTRDLRVALWWGRAMVNLNGFEAVPATIGLLHGLMDRFWEDVHPLPGEDPDALARLSVIGALDKLDSLLGDVRNAPLLPHGQLSGLRVRDVEVALSRLAPRAGEAPKTQAEIAGRLAQVPGAAEALLDQTAAAIQSLDRLQDLMMERFRSDLVVDLKTLRAMLSGLQSLLPQRAPSAPQEPGVAAAAAPSVPARAASGVYSIDSRQDAIRAIELVCAYLERSEPTNPAQLLLRRAARVIDKNFLQLVGELAPEAVRDVARIMGVDPKTVSDEN